MSSAKDRLIAPKNNSSGQYSSSLLVLKSRSLLNSFTRGSKSGALFILLLVVLVVWGEVAGTLKTVDFLIHFDTIKIGPNIGLIILQRLLEGAFIVLSAGVAFSAITTALSTLYLSDDLNFLLAQPISAVRVFSQKLLETFLSSAGLAALLTLPAVLALGYAFAAPWWFYPLSIWLTLIVYALPVGFGAMIAVFLMRFAPAGKVREIATGIGVILSAGLIYFVRALKPEDLLKLVNDSNMSSEQAAKLSERFSQLLEQYAGSQDTLMPPALAARALWDAAHNTFSTSVWGLSILGVVALSIAGWLAALAYREGWVRGLEGTLNKLNTKVLTASAGERFFARFGQMGHILYRDVRLLFRDATQWSQLLILVALVGVYLISIRAYPLEGALATPRFRNVIGYLQLAFQSFVIAGIGIRVAFPAVSLEGYGYWILRTGPVHIHKLVLGKYFAALPPMLLITIIMAVQSSNLIKTTPMVSTITLMVGISSALVITALGVGLGAAFPRFKADNPSEIPMSAGGLLYMLLSLGFATLLALLMATPAYFSIALFEKYNMTVSSSYWFSDGLWILLIYLAVTIVGVIWPLVYGIRTLEKYEQP